MKIINIQVKNILGISEINFLVNEDITDIQGKNGKGKTSLFQAIASIITGKTAGILRNNEDEGEITITFDDGSKIIKKVTENGGQVNWFDINGKKISYPSKKIKETFGSAFNPISFINASDRERLNILLESFPVKMLDGDREKIEGGVNLISKVNFPTHNLTDLEFIEKIRVHVYDSRTGFNKLADTAKKAAEKTTDDLVKIESEFKSAASAADGLNVVEMNNKVSALQSKIVEVNNAFMDKSSKIRERCEQEIQKIRDAMNAEIEAERAISIKETEVYQKEIDGVNSVLSTYDTYKSFKDMLENTKKMIADNEKESLENKAHSDKCSAWLKNLDKVKSNMLKRCLHLSDDINIDIVDGVLYVNDVAFEFVNTAKKIEIAILIGVKNIGDARFMLLDGAECLDADTKKIVAEIASKYDIQLIAFSVSDDEQIIINGETKE